jgi:hypothetical protein
VTDGMRRLTRVSAGVLAVATSGCFLTSPERERRRFDCDGLQVMVSTKQRVPDSLGGEEYVYVAWAPSAGQSIRREIDMNGRWTDRLGASLAEDGSWVRFHLMDPAAPLETVTRKDLDGDGELDFVAERPGPERPAGSTRAPNWRRSRLCGGTR